MKIIETIKKIGKQWDEMVEKFESEVDARVENVDNELMESLRKEDERWEKQQEEYRQRRQEIEKKQEKERIEMIEATAKRVEERTCHKCGGNVFMPFKQGFGFGKAAVGAIALGPVGLLAGGINKDKIKHVCAGCGTYN